ncbi:MAG: hypothetical protein GYA87_03745 [Christensenellaceae bacterium]|nr:hypothetical protein [Christensenellaceae bacterium]
MPHGTDLSNPTEKAVERREYYIKQCRKYRMCNRQGFRYDLYNKYKKALIQNMCYGKSINIWTKKYNHLDKNALFKIRRKALYYLDLILLENDLKKI